MRPTPLTEDRRRLATRLTVLQVCAIAIVGVPLPVMSYGGTSIVTVMAAFGILMSIQTHRRIVEH